MEALLATVRSNIWPYFRLTRLDRPIGTFLLLWPTLWALWLAGNGAPDPTIVMIFILGTFVMRSAGCVVNDIADRNFDGHVKRTQSRPLADGSLDVKRALGALVLLLVMALLLVIQLNALTILVSLLALLITIVYPFSKRFTQLPQCVLGLAFSMGIPMSYTALNNNLPVEAWWLFAGNFLWIVAYDTLYAMADREDDIQIGVKSTAILFGDADKLIIGLLQAGALAVFGYVALIHQLSWHFYAGLTFAGCFAIYQQYLCRDRGSELCYKAFLNNNWFGAMIYCGIVLGTLPKL